eukprot:TRINITY_DN10171_c0_g2_i3.p1 TRINITY_DN10171_c0_g2~~TRINITY_DN10171_c0_g2_i3.p1  ORF type:complete len:138 (+),score=20.36 TRINITY_DN10171_c0_g2_i3:1040-1453(+)
MIVALMTTPNISIQVNLATLGEVLALNSTTVTVTCDSLLPSPLSPTEVYAECTVSSKAGIPSDEYLHQRKLLSPAIWPIATTSLVTASVPGILYITARTTMQPVLPISSCTGGSSSCTTARSYAGLRIVSVAATPLQ